MSRGVAMSLDRVREAFAGDDIDAMEDALRDLWRECRDPVVAAMLAELEADLDSRRTEPEGQDWVDVPGRRVGAKLRWAAKGGSGDAIAERLRRVAAVDLPDPRAAAAAVAMLRDSPSQRNVPLDEVLWHILHETRDPATAEAVATVPPRSLRVRDYAEDGHPLVRCRFAPGFNRRLEAFPATASAWPSTDLTPDERSELVSLVRRRMVELARPALPVGDDLAPLLERILASPNDDGPRQVFADRCIELGDTERGELIALQMKPALDRAGAARVKAILKKRGAEWMGGAAAVTTKQSWVFARGFPHGATIGRASAKAIELSRGAIGWRTMREITVQTNHEAWLLLLEGRSLGALTTVRGDVRRWLRPLGTVWGHRLLELDLVPDAPGGAPRKPPDDLSFPALRRLRLTPTDLDLPAAMGARRPYKLLHLSVPSVGNAAVGRRFLLHPSQALAWLLENQARVDGRIELRFTERDATLLEVHAKPKGARWVYAVAAGPDLDGLDALLDAIAPDVVVRRPLGAG